MLLPLLLRLLLLLLLIMECVRPCRSTCCQTDETPSLLVLLQTAHDYPTPVSCHCYFSSSIMHAAILPRGVAPPNNPSGRVRTASGRATYREMCRYVSPRFRLYPICFLLDLLLQLLLKLLLLPQSAHGHAGRLKIPHSLRTARVPKIVPPSRGFSCCCTSQPPQGYHPPCVQLRLHHRTVPTMVVQQLSLQHLRWVAIDPRWTSLVLRARC